MTGDRDKRTATAAVVVAVAAFAAVQSYSHIYDLARDHGQRGIVGALVPLSVDGLILAAALILSQPSAPRVLARVMLWSGIGATMGANVIYGLGYGVLGALLSAWPAYAFIGGVEMLTGMVRRERTRPATAALSNGHGAPEGGQEAARIFAGDLASGEVPSVRRVRREMHVGQPRAQEVHAYLSTLARTQ